MSLLFDTGRLDNVRPAPTGGGIVVRARVGRTGIQNYGTVRRFRPESEVFAPDSLASFAGAAVTIEHPIDQEGHPRYVTADTWKADAVGTLNTPNTKPFLADDGESWLEADVIVNDAQAVAYIKEQVARGGCECSLGYRVKIDPTPGQHKGQAFDEVQREIRINHLALLPPDSARAGSGARLLFDSLKNPKESPMAQITIDGISYEVGSSQHIAVLDQKVTKLTADRTDLSSKLASTETALAKSDAKIADLEKSAKAVDVDKLVSDAIALRSKASAVLAKDYSYAGKSVRQIQVDSLKAVGFDVPADKSDAYVEASFDARVCEDYNREQDSTKSKDKPVVDARAARNAEYAKRQGGWKDSDYNFS